ncbi:hypothetical protein QN239_31615 [Mycolicibacterium sp. Y3]
MNTRSRFTDLTGGSAGVLSDGQFVVLDQDEFNLGALAPRLQTTALPDNDVVVVGAFAPEVATQLIRIAGLIVQKKQQSERLIDAMFSTTATVTSAAAQQALRNAEARQELLDEFGVFDSEQVAQLAGSTAKNRSATVSRYLAAGQVFAIEHRGGRYYPAFQFDADGRPRPVIAQVLAALRRYGLDGWEIALWFTTASGWLDDLRPVDLLDDDPAEVVAAAGHTVDAVAG